MKQSCNKNYLRLLELAKECGGDNYFSKLLGEPHSAREMQFIEETEKQLCHLDERAWQAFKSKVKGYATRYDPVRGYSQVIDVLNEVKGYNWLKDQGYTSIEFTPEGNGKKPDLHASGEKGEAFVEVKTIHMSDDELICILENSREATYVKIENREMKFHGSMRDKIDGCGKYLIFKGVMSEKERDELQQSSYEPYKKAIETLYKRSQRLKEEGGGVKTRSVELGIPEELKCKLKCAVENAKEQLGENVRKICYLFIDLDIQLGLGAGNYDELDKYLDTLRSENPDIEILCECKRYK